MKLRRPKGIIHKSIHTTMSSTIAIKPRTNHKLPGEFPRRAITSFPRREIASSSARQSLGGPQQTPRLEDERNTKQKNLQLNNLFGFASARFLLALLLNIYTSAAVL